MAKWIDFSGARPGAASIKSNGAEGVLRYLSANVSSTAWKRASKAEIASYIAAGLDVILNFEYYEGRMLEGAAAGKIDGATALGQAKAIGYPKGASIYFSHDTSARNDAAVLAYMKAAQAALGGYYVADIYSGYDVVQLCLKNGVARYGWQTLAWSSGRVGDCHLYQNGNQWYGNGADEDIVRARPLGSWREIAGGKVPTFVAPPAKPAPKPTQPNPETDETYRVVSGDNLSKIAARFHTSPAQLVAWNRSHYPSLASNPNLIQIGWELTVGKKAVSKPSAPVASASTYRVVSGDTLSEIASKHHCTVAQLVAWNRGRYPSLASNPNMIQVGWTLSVRAGAAPAHPSAPSVKEYRVKSGDSLSRIASEFHTSVAQLVGWNAGKYSSLHRNPNYIEVGWVLRVG